jgi:hypothetical protein
MEAANSFLSGLKIFFSAIMIQDSMDIFSFCLPVVLEGPSAFVSPFFTSPFSRGHSMGWVQTS